MCMEQQGINVLSTRGPVAADGVGKLTLARAGLILTPVGQGEGSLRPLFAADF